MAEDCEQSHETALGILENLHDENLINSCSSLVESDAGGIKYQELPNLQERFGGIRVYNDWW